MIRWLDQINQDDLPLVGGKAANLGAMTQAGFPVPPGFCLTTAAWHTFVQAHHLDDTLRELRKATETASATETERHAALVREQIERATVPQEIVDAVRRAYAELPSRLPTDHSPAGNEPPVAVRSSATDEDLPDMSFAGQQDTYLNVTGLDDLLHHIRACWASLWTGRAVQYRSAKSVVHADMAVVVQAMIPCDVAGVAFSIDPLTGEDAVVIEAVPGLGDALMNGEAEPVRYQVLSDGALIAEPGDSSLLPPQEVHRLASMVNLLADHFGSPQDTEWGYRDGELLIFQSRPITAQGESFFNQSSPDPDRLWAAAFLNERFPQPVSPLGWSLVRSLLEPLAYQDPLHYLGVHDLDEQPLTRLHRGHPYTDATVFWRIYKLFPDALLPEDAVRYFPEGDVSLRKTVPSPRWSSRLLWTILRSALADLRNWSPLHNWRTWQRFVPQHEAEMNRLTSQAEAALAPFAEAPDDAEKRLAVWRLIGAGQELSRRLLQIHRWSLVHADLTYSSLRRLCVRIFGPEEGALVAAQQVARLPTSSFLLDQALRQLANQARNNPPLQQALESSSLAELAERLAPIPDGQTFLADLEQFLAAYGHRAYSLDIYQPSFRDDPAQVLTLIRELARNDGTQPLPRKANPETARENRRMLWVVQPLVSLAQRYVLLREEQRFFWQRTLALQRRLVVALGQALARIGYLEQAHDVFFLTLEELGQAVTDPSPRWNRIAQRRRETHADLRREQALAPVLAYAEFLRGDTPLLPGVAQGDVLQGRPVSPGVGRGPVRVIRSPSDFDNLRPGDILVTTSPDPGWTPVFGIIAGLVMERGGQLSHGAVVAREYGLPAVAGLPGVTGRLRDGERVLVDGRTGIVQREG